MSAARFDKVSRISQKMPSQPRKIHFLNEAFRNWSSTIGTLSSFLLIDEEVRGKQAQMTILLRRLGPVTKFLYCRWIMWEVVKLMFTKFLIQIVCYIFMLTNISNPKCLHETLNRQDKATWITNLANSTDNNAFSCFWIVRHVDLIRNNQFLVTISLPRQLKCWSSRTSLPDSGKTP